MYSPGTRRSTERRDRSGVSRRRTRPYHPSRDEAAGQLLAVPGKLRLSVTVDVDLAGDDHRLAKIESRQVDSAAHEIAHISPLVVHDRVTRMDLRKLKTLIELVESSGIAELEIQEGEERVRITRSVPPGGAATTTNVQLPLPSGQPIAPARRARGRRRRRGARARSPKAISSRARWSARSIAPPRRAPNRLSRSATPCRRATRCASSRR